MCYITDSFNDHIRSEERKECISQKKCELCENMTHEEDFFPTVECIVYPVCKTCITNGNVEAYIKARPNEFDVEMELKDLENLKQKI